MTPMTPMTPLPLRSAGLALLLALLSLLAPANAANLNYSGEALTTRFWDCCKPSCAWKNKADFSQPVQSCSADDKPVDFGAGTGCNGGSAFLCSSQQPWAINDTLSYGFAGAFITAALTGGGIEDAWCCACYQLDFTSEPLKGKRMIVQASNTAYDLQTSNRFTLAVPGGNTTSNDGCARQFGVDQTVFGDNKKGVGKKEDCKNLPEQLRRGCEWRFDWLKDASFPSAKFKRVVCPREITEKTGCVRSDDDVLAGKKAMPSSAGHPFPAPAAASAAGVVAAIIVGLLSV